MNNSEDAEIVLKRVRSETLPRPKRKDFTFTNEICVTVIALKVQLGLLDVGFVSRIRQPIEWCFVHEEREVEYSWEGDVIVHRLQRSLLRKVVRNHSCVLNRVLIILQNC